MILLSDPVWKTSGVQVQQGEGRGRRRPSPDLTLVNGQLQQRVSEWLIGRVFVSTKSVFDMCQACRA